ncbi:hypothetical protein [Azospirillum sp. TSO5]|uniref:hypothetical protein n=1 Tax=Azospirillum sp. TSO5 TaxID=716760 RepID=UPI000D60B6AD|nr:hypothetical protein [Azospirillum sp. TSO5]PWC97716.1 hypothetical protein TSO5_04225 [Azospirillum sp. TSO5]
MDNPRSIEFVPNEKGYLEADGIRVLALLPPVVPTETTPTIGAALLTHLNNRIATALNAADPTLAGDIVAAIRNCNKRIVA